MTDDVNDDLDTVASETSRQTPRRWQDDQWTAQVIKNEDDEGWAVAMTKAGQQEPALVGPWTMGRDKKNPKPLDSAAFTTLVKTASEVIRRHEQQRDAQLHKKVEVVIDRHRFLVLLDIVPDDDMPYATLTAIDQDGAEVGKCAAPITFRLNKDSAEKWIESSFAQPTLKPQ